MKLKGFLKNQASEGGEGSGGSGMTASANTGQPVGDEKTFSASAKTTAAATDTGQPSTKPNNDDVSDVGSQVQS